MAYSLTYFTSGYSYTKCPNLKTDLKSYKQGETAAGIFNYRTMFLKQGIDNVYVRVDIICMGLLKLQGTQSKNFKVKTSCPQWDLKPVPCAYEADTLSIVRWDLISTIG